MSNLWHKFLAYYRLSDKWVCELSKGRDLYDDYHDWRDSIADGPYHMYVHKCRRCKKEFII